MAHSSPTLNFCLALVLAPSLGWSASERPSPLGSWQFQEDLGISPVHTQASAQVLYLDSWGLEKSLMASVYHPSGLPHLSVGYGTHYRMHSQELDWGALLQYITPGSFTLAYGLEQKQFSQIQRWNHSLGLGSSLIPGLDLKLCGEFNREYSQSALGLLWQAHPSVQIQSQWIWNSQTGNQWRLYQSWQALPWIQVYSTVDPSPLRISLGIEAHFTAGHHTWATGANRSYHTHLSPSQAYWGTWSLKSQSAH